MASTADTSTLRADSTAATADGAGGTGSAPVFGGSGTATLASSNNGTLALAFPSGVAQNDILWVAIWSQNSGYTFSMSAEWTKLGPYAIGGEQFILWWCRRGASNPDSTVTVSGSHRWTGVMWRVADCVTTGTPYECFEVASTSTGTSLDWAASSSPTTGTDRLALHLGGGGEDDSYGTTPAGWTNNIAIPDGGGGDGVLLLDSLEMASAGTIPATSRAYAAAARVTVSLALIPVASGGGSDVTGTLAATETGADTVAITGSVETSGSLSAAETGSDTASFSGSVEASGFLAAAETGGDTAAFTGSVSAPGVAGSLAATETGDDTASFAGTVTAPDVSGSLNATETGSDTASFTGTAEGGDIPTTRQGDGDILSGGQARARRAKREDDPRSAMERLIDRFRAAQKAVEKTPEAAPVRKVMKKAVSEARKALPAAVEMAPAFDWQALLSEMEAVSRVQGERERQIDVIRRAIAQAEQIQREIEEDEDTVLMLFLAA